MSLFIVVVFVGFGFIVAEIAKSKGYVLKQGEKKQPKSKKQAYITWWFCGAALFIVSIFYVLALPDINDQTEQPTQNIYYAPPGTQDLASELQKYKDLYDRGLITQEDYEKKKSQLLNM